MNRYYIQRLSAETCEDVLKKYNPDDKQDVIIVRMYDEPFDLKVKIREAMSEQEFETFRKLVNGSGEFRDIIDIIMKKKEQETQEVIINKQAEENNQ
jgi:hypothetical protein|tara:strand:- start:261 stop:551 length:291 start_codon:yes stop_codon:yes gene_type:complete